MSGRKYRTLIDHLLPAEAETEQAAFLFARCQTRAKQLTLRIVDQYLVQPEECRICCYGHLELCDSTLERVIKHAHDLGVAIIETHSHPYQLDGGACFSFTDRNGLAEVVPHVMWRLPDRPYAAIVVAPEGLDALMWDDPKRQPRTIDAVLVGSRTIVPTGNTMRELRRFRGSF